MICGAKTRTGGKCKSTPMPNGRCRLHGGKTPKGPASPHFKDGRRSKYMYLPENLTARFEALTGDAIRNIEESITIQKALETQLHEKLGTGESPDAWRAMVKTLGEMGKPDGLTLGEGMARLREIADGALGEQSLRREIQSVHETQRKLTETLTKCRKDVQETYTQEQWNVMLNIIMNTIRKYVTDAESIRNITTEWDAYRNRSGNEGAGLLVAGAAEGD